MRTAWHKINGTLRWLVVLHKWDTIEAYPYQPGRNRYTVQRDSGTMHTIWIA